VSAKVAALRASRPLSEVPCQGKGTWILAQALGRQGGEGACVLTQTVTSKGASRGLKETLEVGKEALTLTEALYVKQEVSFHVQAPHRGEALAFEKEAVTLQELASSRWGDPSAGLQEARDRGVRGGLAWSLKVAAACELTQTLDFPEALGLEEALAVQAASGLHQGSCDQEAFSLQEALCFAEALNLQETLSLQETLCFQEALHLQEALTIKEACELEAAFSIQEAV